MEAESSYGIGYYLAGHYHILCREGNVYRFRIVRPHSKLEPEEMNFYEARRFIETHPVCTNITNHEIRIMNYGEILDIIQGKPPASSFKSLILGSEEEEEEPLH